jgi:hypothetical protein
MGTRNLTMASYIHTYIHTYIQTPAQAAEKIPSFILDAQKGLDGYTKLDNGLMIKDVVEGLGVAPKDTDLVRLQFAAYLKDGTLLSRYEVLFVVRACVCVCARARARVRVYISVCMYVPVYG